MKTGGTVIVLCVLALGMLGACVRSADDGAERPAPPSSTVAAAPAAPPAPAEPVPSREEIRETCKSYSEMARAIMKNRQEGAPMQDIIAIVTDGKNPGAEQFGEQLVIAAYELPRMSAEKNKQREVDDFANAVYLDCIKGS
jgi:3-oxoacyl-ACP reductase-like protein